MGKRTIAAAALVASVVTCLLASASAADLAGWRGYVRRVVDAFGPNSRVVAMTITNEVNLTISPNTSDGAYPRAQDALIEGIETARGGAGRPATRTGRRSPRRPARCDAA